METSLFLAQFWGWLLVLTGAGVLIQSDSFLKSLDRLSDDKGFLLTSGYLALVIGLVTVLLHNVWSKDVTVLVTVFGWLSLIKGVVRLAFPKVMGMVAKWFQGQVVLTKIMLVVMVFLGLWLLVATR